ncbi:putative alpha/beta hydrolase [Aspergillus nomiae NRRL 13137]|uniref:Putative alpha/beta hydrolase n=1 Tax=Aspergillus nomiae NRRL (strain ATCC 15546 / NRRL 13137 / CBS 260.88 / M93) TaxID=1509407 RepID=A0A0L1J6Y4_ASPN3|nr:putative alpha/beta hydrolase [Aspergillus nomiae NRRL 13137]KNG87499.1 putative alpha/beta hydrolase [Aspergillus nomiae NRRL 13137]
MASQSLESSKDDLASHQGGTPHAARGASATPPPSAWFPLGYREGFSQWWSCLPAAAAEHKVLSYLPYLQHEPPTHLQTGKTSNLASGEPGSLQSADHSQEGEVAANSLNDPYGPRRWRSSMVELSGKNRALNEFSVERIGEEANQHLVMIHGYGAGLGFFYKNFEPLSRLKGWQLHALDLLGMGRSTRPPFRIKAKDREDAIREAEAWFVDALEEWRIKRKIDRFTLLGHIGIPEDPYAVSADMPSESTMATEFSQDQRNIADSASSVPPETIQKGDNNILLKGPPTGSAAPDQRPRRMVPKWFAYLWDANISPFSLIRWAGPLGPRLVSGWTSRRFSHLPADEAKALHDYSYSIFSQRGSGEYALAYILAPGAFARSPLIRRIQGVGRQMLQTPSSSTQESTQSIESSRQNLPQPDSTIASGSSLSTPAKRENGLPIVFMYGDHDWMDVKGGMAAKAKLDAEKRKVLQNATPEERNADHGSAKVVVIKNSGHHVYLDGWEEFNSLVLSEMEDVDRKAAQ